MLATVGMKKNCKMKFGFQLLVNIEKKNPDKLNVIKSLLLFKR